MCRLAFAFVVFQCSFVAAASAQTSTAVAYNYATLTYPGAIATSANGINNNNVIVGSYLDSASFVHGYVYRTGKYNRVDFPGATATEVLGINDYGDIVGMYELPGPLNFHGFLRHNGEFHKIDVPSATFSTVAAGVNNSGSIVGTYDDTRGFIYREGAYKTWKAPQLKGEPTQTQLNGINNLGWISGQVFSGGNWRGFWLVGKDLDFLEPLFSADNEVTGINGRSDVVGCHDAASGFVSFNVEASEGSEKTERFPRRQRLTSCASAINFARVIVGNYFTATQSNGYLAVPALTLKVTSPANHALLTNPVHLLASASGSHPVSQIQVWVNSKKVLQVRGSTLAGSAWLPTGKNERLGIQAIDSKGTVTKVVQTITVQ
jgi:uncharacterized membrane protein